MAGPAMNRPTYSCISTTGSNQMEKEFRFQKSKSAISTIN